MNVQVEKIVDHKKKKDGWYYRVKWMGWDAKYNTWEAYDNLRKNGAMGAVEDFKRVLEVRLCMCCCCIIEFAQNMYVNKGKPSLPHTHTRTVLLT